MAERIAAALRVRDESRWIGAVLESIKPVCSPIIVMDDHSTDDTAAICAQHGATIHPSPFEGLDEYRDKNWLMDKVRPLAPDWLLCLDGDEVLDPAGPDQIRGLIANGAGVDAYLFQILYLWDRVDQVRMDGVYGRFYRNCLYRWRSDLAFGKSYAPGNLHAVVEPRFTIRTQHSGIKLWHFGLFTREDRLRKVAWHNGRDPNNEQEDCYRHCIQGDVPEIPADMKLKHAGPMRLEAVK